MDGARYNLYRGLKHDEREIEKLRYRSIMNLILASVVFSGAAVFTGAARKLADGL